MMAMPINKTTVVDFTQTNIHRYGMHVLTQRALVDYRDGLKPVHRRILFAMYEGGFVSSGPMNKAARIVADTMGKYHPHGNMAIYDAVVTLANLPVPLVEGQGNWGQKWTESQAAAERYTECRMSKFADQYIIPREYMNCDIVQSKFHDNYDGKDREPLFLPSLLPNVLLNGNEGIASGISTFMPPFKLKGVVKLIDRYMRGKKVTTQDCIDTLEFNFNNTASGGNCLASPDQLAVYYDSGHATLWFTVDTEIDAVNQTVNIVGIDPRFKIDTAIERLSKHLPIFKELRNLSKEKIKLVVTFKERTTKADLEHLAGRIETILKSHITMQTNVTLRREEENIEPMLMTVPTVLTAWCDYRIELEKSYQDYLIANETKNLSRQQLLRLAVDSVDIILASVKKDDPTSYLAKKLDISAEDADAILELKVRQLTKMSGDKIDETIKSIKTKIKIAKGHRADPNAKIVADLAALPKTLFA